MSKLIELKSKCQLLTKLLTTHFDKYIFFSDYLLFCNLHSSKIALNL